MKKLLLLMILVLACALTLSACGNSAETTTPADTDNTTFTVGFDKGFPPYGYVADDGSYTGFDLELAAEVAKRNGWELVLQPISWDAKDAELESGAIDCIWNGFTINGREDQYTWTEPYVDNTQVFVVKSDSGIKSAADLAGKTIMTQADSSALTALESEDYADTYKTFGKVITTSDYNSAFMELEAGAVDAIATDVGVANFQITDRDTEFVILDEPLSTEQYGIGFLLGNTELRDTVQATLKEMVKDGTVDKIIEKYAKWNIAWILE
ncbi:MAG: amino acid ABC transporter substrate-binding protein [Bacillota bacterium]|jgi:polar amino acid transport system substrate-binding protein